MIEFVGFRRSVLPIWCQVIQLNVNQSFLISNFQRLPPWDPEHTFNRLCVGHMMIVNVLHSFGCIQGVRKWKFKNNTSDNSLSSRVIRKEIKSSQRNFVYFGLTPRFQLK